MSGKIIPGDDDFDTWQGFGLADIYGFNQGMRVNTSFDSRVEKVFAELNVIGIFCRAGHFFVNIDTGHVLTNELRCFTSFFGDCHTSLLSNSTGSFKMAV
jgi:hypothetical protein